MLCYKPLSISLYYNILTANSIIVRAFVENPGSVHRFVYTFKALHGSAPTYIHQLIRLKPQSNYNMRSNTKHLVLDLRNKTKKTTGDSAFFAAAPTLWNALPDELRALGSLKTFMARLKTHYFKLAFSL